MAVLLPTPALGRKRTFSSGSCEPEAAVLLGLDFEA